MSGIRSKICGYALAGISMLAAGCASETASDPMNSARAIVRSDVPLVSGNTFDYWNRLDKFSPEAMTINISYRYIYNHTFPISMPQVVSAQSWIYLIRSKPVPDRLLMITVRQDEEDSDDPGGRVLVFGRHQFVSEVTCLSRGEENVPADLADYVQKVWSQNPEISDDLILHRYIGSSREDDGSRLEIVHAEDITRAGYSCAELSDMDDPSEETKAILEKFRENSERSFEVIG